MKIEDVRKNIERMQKADADGDFERAGINENAMMEEFIAAVADGTYEGDVQEAARLLKKALGHSNPRWFA